MSLRAKSLKPFALIAPAVLLLGVFLVLPYVASLVLLAGLRSRTHQPVALGIPYRRE